MAKTASLDALAESARRSKNYAGGLLSEYARLTAGAIAESRPGSGTVEIKASGWKNDAAEAYPAYYS